MTAWRSAGASPVRSRAAYGAAGSQPGLRRVVDEQPPHLLERDAADEVLDVDAAVAKRTAVAIGLGDLRLEGDDALEARLELAHRSPRCSTTGSPLTLPDRWRSPVPYAQADASGHPDRRGRRSQAGHARPAGRKGTTVNGRKKVTVVGAGNVGATCAQEVARRDYADIVLVDVKPNFAAGKALDINQAGSVLGYEPSVVGVEASGYAATAGSDVIVITAGLPRKPGMSRDDLVKTNEAIVAEVTREVAKRSKNAVLVIVSNPLDAMCHVAKAVSKFPRERVVGMAGVLDTSRFECFIAQETGLSVKEVTAMVLGGHGDQMVPVVSATTVAGIPLDQLVTRSKITKMVERTKVGGGELVKLLGTSAWYAPGAAAAQMVDAICLDEKRVLPATAYLEGEYGIRDLYMGVPVRLGAGGAEEVVKLKLTAAEKKMLKVSEAAVRDVVSVLSVS